MLNPSAPFETDLNRPVTPLAGGDPARTAGAALPVRKIALGEELPIFCERCGYALHGLPQQVCDHCTIRQFHCPECGHHQPINTLRPAFQKTLGRIRAFFLCLSILFKLNFFGWLLVAWCSMGHEMSYSYRYSNWAYSQSVTTVGPGGTGRQRIRSPVPDYGPRQFQLEDMLAFGLFGLAFGLVGRMLLLRWRRGYLVGLSLAALVCTAVVLGAKIRHWEGHGPSTSLPSPFTVDFVSAIVLTVLALILGASVVWGIWSALAYVFLPKRASQALLEWQRSLSNRSAGQLARE
ncbi:MAG TPA: hypothetical protein VH475_25495 [Tepidisphaeraceae bacterium]|jgi:hypothetical protein